MDLVRYSALLSALAHKHTHAGWVNTAWGWATWIKTSLTSHIILYHDIVNVLIKSNRPFS